MHTSDTTAEAAPCEGDRAGSRGAHIDETTTHTSHRPSRRANPNSDGGAANMHGTVGGPRTNRFAETMLPSSSEAV